jgi:hypothetical protein
MISIHSLRIIRMRWVYSNDRLSLGHHLIPEGDHFPVSTNHLPPKGDHLASEGDHLHSAFRGTVLQQRLDTPESE